MDLFGLENLKVLDTLRIREILDFLPHSITEQRISFGYRPAEDNDSGIIGEHDHLDKLAHMDTELIHYLQGFWIAIGRGHRGFFS